MDVTRANAVDINRKIIHLEEQVKQLKTPQQYGLGQIRYFESTDVSVNSGAWYYNMMQMDLNGTHAVVEFVGIYPEKTAVGEVAVTFSNFSGDSSELYWAAVLLPTNEKYILRYDFWAQHLHLGVPMDPQDSTYSRSFTANIIIRANMDGVLRLVSSETPQGLIDVFSYQ